MAPRPRKPLALTIAEARRIWLRAQRLDSREPFGSGPDATRAAVEHLGYVQIDTINVIERCHHHILYARIPAYERGDLAHAQSVDKSVFEYWTHALSYVPAADIRYFLPAMKAHRGSRSAGRPSGAREETRKLLRRIRKDGALTIRDIDDDVLVEKAHLWASKKPSKGLLERAFYDGELVISARSGMLKTYELIDRHFGWEKRPTPASERQVIAYKLDRALRAQGIVSLDSACHLDAPSKKAVAELIAATRPPQGARPRRGRGSGEGSALGAARDAGSDRAAGRRARPYPLALRSADHPAQAAEAVLRLSASVRGLSAEGEARLRLFRPAGSGGRPHRRRARSQDRPRRRQAPAPAMDLARRLETPALKTAIEEELRALRTLPARRGSEAEPVAEEELSDSDQATALRG